ncbi:hypothetical protein ABT034_33115 [Streptomyces sp. NPDC002773]|uniref:hypothetical protein n=1 Tax=Streptomyces sp. NPDC002773 TaxID=3154430 RepID=UPI0033308389
MVAPTERALEDIRTQQRQADEAVRVAALRARAERAGQPVTAPASALRQAG